MSVTINYDLVLDTALKGVRRAAVFMGLGLNAALDPNYKSYELIDIAALQLVPANADDTTITHYKENFALWITANGLRELIEAFSIFLDQVHYASQNIAVHKGQRTSDDATKSHKRFTEKGAREKLQILEADFGIVASHSDYISTIYLARNCLTHRLGRVDSRDCNEGSELVVKWIGLDILTTTKSGETMIMDLPLKKPLLLEAETTVSVRSTVHEQRYGLGTVIHIPPKHLAEICLFMTEEAKSVVRSALEYARRLGVEVQGPNTTANSSQTS
jgi:hypothetical protein